MTAALLMDRDMRVRSRRGRLFARRSDAGGCRGEGGSAALELVLVAPFLVVVLLLVAGLARMAHARQQVADVANLAGRAASLERDPARLGTAARSAASRVLSDDGVACRDLAVSVDTGADRPGGTVQVTVRCTADLSDVAMTGLPGRHVFAATAVVPIESYRAN